MRGVASVLMQNNCVLLTAFFTTDREVTATAFREFKRGLGIDAEMLSLLSALHRNLDDAAGRAVLCADDAK